MDLRAQAASFEMTGRFEEAQRLYQLMREANPGDFDACYQLGLIAFRQGDPQAARTLFGTALAAKPNDASAWMMQGLALQAMGDPQASLASHDKAVALAPDMAAAHANRANALQMLNRAEDALADYDAALRCNPRLASARSNRGGLLLQAGRLDEALADLNEALAIKPDFPAALNNRGQVRRAMGHARAALDDYDSALAVLPDDATLHNNRGNALWDMEQLDEALDAYASALTVRPGYAEALCNQGQVQLELGRREDAIASLRQAVAAGPEHSDSWLALGNALVAGGALGEAQGCYQKAASRPALENLALLLLAQGDARAALQVIKPLLAAPDQGQIGKIFADCIAGLDGGDTDLRGLLETALNAPWARPGDLVRAAARFLLDPPSPNDPLLQALLCAAPNVDLALERFLTRARHELLAGELDNVEFAAALARQCFINDYVFACGVDEQQQAHSLRDALAAGEKLAPLQLLALASYFPLGEVPGCEALLQQAWPEALQTVLTQQIAEPADERRLKATIPRLTNITAPVSQLVQAQYEAHPYPRWVRLAPVVPARSVGAYLRRKFPLSAFDRRASLQKEDILVAGCGTGQHSAATAAKFPAAQVLAVDLSRASLAYAMRMSCHLDNLEHAQADLTQLDGERRFDAIESVGVLHHLADPLAGWTKLQALLQPGGFMMVGLYSETARRGLAQARAFIKEQGFAETSDGIRQCRQQMKAEEHAGHFAAILASPDFFSTSSCRDLLFHVQEQSFTLDQVAEFLDKHALNFLGFELDGALLQAYRLRFPNDPAATNLKQWQLFEKENPGTFAAMYQFWIQKAP